MNPLTILIVIACYFALLFLISYLAGRKADNAGFFSGNRSSNWLLVAMSTIGAAISGVTFVSVPGMVATSGWAYMQMVLGFTVGQIIIAYVLIPLYYKLNLTSIYQYLQQRFGMNTYKSGAWLFFVSKMLGASVRLFVVGEVLQLLVFGPLGIPFWVNAIFTVLIVYLCTFKGGVKSLIWTDLLKTCCLILSVALCIYFVLRAGVNIDGWTSSDMTRTFFFDNPKEGTYFWKQFLAGVFLVIATTGLDQDLMQRTLSCKNPRESQKNLIVGALMQIVVIGLFLFLGFLLYSYANQTGVALVSADGAPLKGDDVFPFLATGNYFPVIVGILFIIGFIAAAYSAAGSALTALTTSFTVDILNKEKDANLTKVRTIVHIGMAVLMAVCIYVIHILNNDSVIQTVYKVASYTYGPLLGMFCFGIFTKRQVRDRWIPLVVILAPVITWIIDVNSAVWFNGYVFSHERLILNALLTFMGMVCLLKGSVKTKQG
ncbi:MAG: sodium:solute symporter [Paludibacteraceae bacterium]|nr:sodium:solute symporter [Paludibacteraceae bacterium]